MSVQKKQFIEMEFVGKLKDSGEVFDTSDPKKAAALGLKNIKPAKICVGEKMLPEKFDSYLVGKEVGKEYSLELSPKEAFGERKADLIKTIPLRIFREKGVQPYKGMLLNIDGSIVKIISASGGRVIADFNNPLAGKNIIYEFKIIRIIDDLKEKVNIFFNSFLKLKPKNVIIEDKKALLELSLSKKEFKFYQELFKTLASKFKELTSLDIELRNSEREKEKKENKEENKDLKKA